MEGNFLVDTSSYKICQFWMELIMWHGRTCCCVLRLTTALQELAAAKKAADYAAQTEDYMEKTAQRVDKEEQKAEAADAMQDDE